MKALLVAVGLGLSNFAYQYFMQEPNFAVAFERTWFQANALLTYYLFDKFIWKDWK